MNDTPFPEGAQPQPEDADASQYPPDPYDPQTPLPPEATLPPSLPADVAPGTAAPPPQFQPSAPAGFAAATGFTPVLAPATSARRRGPIWPWIVGAFAAVALICALGLAAGMAIQAARGAMVAATPSAHNRPGEGRQHGDGPGFPQHGGILVVTGISGNAITATRADGSTVTITVTSSTVISGMDQQPASVSDIRAGSRIGVEPLPKSGSSVTATRIIILPYTVAGTVSAVGATTITVTHGQQTQTITVTSATTFKGEATSLSGVIKGMLVMAQGPSLTNGALDATVVVAETPPVAGKVTAVTATTITVTDLQGASRTITVNTSTRYTSFADAGSGTPAATAATIQPGVYILARGTLDASGAFTAQTVIVLPAPGAGGWGGPPNGAWPGAGPNQPDQSN